MAFPTTDDQLGLITFHCTRCYHLSAGFFFFSLGNFLPLGLYCSNDTAALNVSWHTGMLFWLTKLCLRAGWEIFCQFCFSQKIHFSQHRFASVWGTLTSGIFGLKVRSSIYFFSVFFFFSFLFFFFLS